MVRLATVVLMLTFTQPGSEWIQLFNGKDLSGWTPKLSGYALGENYKNTFRVEDGLLKVSYDEYEDFDGEFGHLFLRDAVLTLPS